MARTQLDAQVVARDGLSPTFEAANADGHSFVNNHRRALWIKNGDGVPHTATVLYGQLIDGQTVPGQDVTVADGDEAITAFFPPGYHQPGGQDVHIDYDAVTSVTVAVLEFPTVT